MGNNSNRDYDYTLVLDSSYTEASEHEDSLGTEVERLTPKTVKEQTEETEHDSQADSREKADHLYRDYEKMCFREPTILDKDDAYPHSYQWRMGGRYDEDKIKVVEAALREGRRIEDTEAYQAYVEAIRNRKFTPDSWD
jgi:hypothetical protein